MDNGDTGFPKMGEVGCGNLYPTCSFINFLQCPSFDAFFASFLILGRLQERAVERGMKKGDYESFLLRNHGHQDYKEIGKTKQVILLIGGCSFHIEVGTYLSHYNILNNGCITIIYHNRNIPFTYKLIVSVNLQHTLLTLQFKKLKKA